MNIAFCPNCGTQLPEGALFCGTCGTKIVVPSSGDKDERVATYLSEVTQAQQQLVSTLRDYRLNYPELAQMTFFDEENDEISEENCVRIIETIKGNANLRYCLPAYPTRESFVDIVQTTRELCDASYIITPRFAKEGNIVLLYDKTNQQFCKRSLSIILFNMLLTLPVGKLRFKIVDLNNNLLAEEINRLLPVSIVGEQSIGDEHTFNSLLDELIQKVESIEKQNRNVILMNKERKAISQPYEVIVLSDGYAYYKRFEDKLRRLVEAGSKAGIYFVLVTQALNDNNDDTFIDKAEKELGVFKNSQIDVIEELKIKNGLVYPKPIWETPVLREACLKYIHQEIENAATAKSDKQDLNILAKNDYEPVENEICVPVGEEMNFKMNTINHVHSFIVGQSGSGKSVFLHNVIGSTILKYAPEDLQLYLLDFKLGGVEFNRYKGVKHVKAMLVDNSDQQITLEILRELRNSMAERGKLLRDSGVSNIREYNQGHPNERMPHVLLIADECHEMFRADDSIPRSVSSEISDIVTKVAKEGRSQGVHLILATQTLSGAEISNEILNNISDHYLLKCAPTDSERLVPGSSDITAMQATGQIYYHHVDEQQQFQAFYTNKEEAAKIITTSIEKAASHPDNGAFYFSGSQIFELDANIMDGNKKIRKMPVVYMGKSIDLKQKDLCINLREDYSENILVFGLNDGEQVTRTSLNLLLSSAMAARMGELDVQIKVLDCLTNDESKYEDLMDELEDSELCEMVTRRKRGDFLKKMAESIKDGSAEPTLIYILGQDRFRELKMDMEFESDDAVPADDFASMLGAFSSSSDSGFKTYRQALSYILDRGPEQGVHTIIQIEKPTNLLFEDLTAKEIFQKFKHLIMLRSDEMTGSRLNLRDDIRLERLSSDSERLRAYYYAEESDAYTLFTPYEQDGSTKIIKTIEKL